MTKTTELEEFVDGALKQFAAMGYFPSYFLQMRARWGTQKAIERLVISGEVQSGLHVLKTLNLLDLSMEAATLKFPDLFTKDIRDAAKFRLTQVGWKPPPKHP